MKKLFKQSLAVLLSATLLLTAATFASSAAEMAPQEESVGAESGKTGDCTWTLDNTGTLTISGNGTMGDYDIKNFAGTWITLNYSRISGIAYENGYVRENSSKTDTLQRKKKKKGALLPWGSDNF